MPRHVESSFLTVVMAAIFALSLVPAGAFASSTDNQHGEMYGDNPYDTSAAPGLGEIKIANTKANEKYNVYRILDLASFSDSDTTPGVHAVSTTFDEENDKYTGEAYSYVIREASPWWKFLMVDKAVDGANNYAAYKAGASDSPAGTYNQGAADGYEGAPATQLFWVEPQAIRLTDANGEPHDDYHVVTATKRFLNTWDVDAAETTNTSAFPYNGQDYVEPGTRKESIKVVQDFAQSALAYAQKQVTGTGGSSSDNITPNYVEAGEADGEVTVNAAATNEGTVNTEFGSDSPLKVGTSKVPLGWYLVGTTMGTLASLDTTNTNVTIYNKNQEPSLEKKVLRKGAAAPSGTMGNNDIDRLVRKTLETWQKSDANNAGKGYADAPENAIDWVDNTDADVNDLVMFRTVIDARQGVRDYRLHDVMEKGLEFVDSGTALPAGYVTDENATAATYAPRVFLVRGTDTSTNEDNGVWEVESTGKVTGENDDRTNWTLKTKTSNPKVDDDDCDFEIVFADATNDKTSVTTGDKDAAVTFVCTDHVARDIKDGDRIVVLYWAKVLPTAIVYGTEDGTASGDAADQTTVWDNETAGKAASDRKVLVGNDGNAYAQAYKETDENNRNTNSTILTYGAKSHTEWKRAEVTTYQLDVVKTQDSTSAVYDLLKGAQFRMYKATTKQADRMTTPTFTNPAIPSTGINVKRWDATANDGTGGFVNAIVYQEGKAMLFTPVGSFQTTPASDNNTPDDNTDDVAAANVASYRYQGDKATDGQTSGDKTTANVLVSDNAHEISVHGLEEGWYILVEEEAPEGFNKLANPIAIYVNGDMDASHRLDYNGTDDTANKDEGKLNVNAKANNASLPGSDGTTYVAWNGTVSANPMGGTGTTEGESNPHTYTKTNNGGVHIVNQTGQELSSTGGIGTTVFYVAGTVLVVGAAVMLVAKRRMGAEA